MKKSIEKPAEYPGVKTFPKAVLFRYPNGLVRKGTITNAVYNKYLGRPGGDYLFVIEEIVWADQPRKKTLRFGYYRKENMDSRWRWGSQTTFHTDKEGVEKILRKAIRKGLLNIVA